MNLNSIKVFESVLCWIQMLLMMAILYSDRNKSDRNKTGSCAEYGDTYLKHVL